MASGKTSTSSSVKPVSGMIVSTEDFTSGQALPTSLVLATSYTDSIGQSAVLPSTSTSGNTAGGSSSPSVDVGGTALASPQDKSSHAVRASVRTKASSLALGVLVLVLVLIA